MLSVLRASARMRLGPVAGAGMVAMKMPLLGPALWAASPEATWRGLSTAPGRNLQPGRRPPSAGGGGGGGSGGGGRQQQRGGGGKGSELGGSTGLVKNEDIRFPSMRVVFKDDAGASNWKVLTRKEALAFAKEQSLDLVLVDGKAEPPVCRLANFGHMLMEKRSKEKEKKTSQKAKALKEIYIRAGIDPHDLGIKLNKCRDFLEDGHQVKIVLMVNKATLAGNPLALDETTLKVIESLETHAGTVQQPSQLNPMRKDFTISPKK